MFAQSYTGRFLLSLCNTFFDCENSLLVRFLVKIVNRLKSDFYDSRLLKILTAIVEYIQKLYNTSLLKTYVSSGKHLQNAYADSLLCACITAIYDLAVQISGGIYKKLYQYNQGGFLYRIFSPLLSQRAFFYDGLLALFIGFMFLCPHELWNNLYALAAVFGFSVWYMIRVYNGKAKADVKSLGFGLTLFIIFIIFSVFIAYSKTDALRISLFALAAIGFYLCVKGCANSKDRLFYMVKVIAVFVTLTGVYGILQRISGVKVNPEYVDMSTGANMPGRVFSTFANPNNFAELLVLFMPMLAALFVIASGRKEKSFWALCFLVTLAALGMSYSRSCWVALAMALVVLLLVYDWKLIVPLGIVALLSLPLLPASITDRMLTTGSMNDSSNAYRLYIWSGAANMVKNFFFTGVGAGPSNFSAYYKPLADFRAITAPHSHMIYMELIIEFSIFGALGFFLHFASVIKKGFAHVRVYDKQIRALVGACLGSMVGMLFVCSAEYVWFYPRDLFAFWIVLGILSAATNLRKKEKSLQ